VGPKMACVAANTCCGVHGACLCVPVTIIRMHPLEGPTRGRTEGPALGPTVHSYCLSAFACCGTDAGAAMSTTGLKTVRLDI
jgi:hypothetical protein